MIIARSLIALNLLYYLEIERNYRQGQGSQEIRTKQTKQRLEKSKFHKNAFDFLTLPIKFHEL